MIFATLQYLHSSCVAIKHEETQYLCVGFKLNSIFLFLIWFFLFCFWTPQFYKSSSFHIKYVENMWKCLVKYAFMCHHVSLKTFIKKTGKKIETFIKLSHSFVKHYQYYNLFPKLVETAFYCPWLTLSPSIPIPWFPVAWKWGHTKPGIFLEQLRFFLPSGSKPTKEIKITELAGQTLV